MNNRPAPSEYEPYFEAYISLVPESDVMEVLRAQLSEVRTVVRQFDVVALESLQGPYTWTPKQVLGHCIDTERVMGYRAATILGSDDADLPGFDQDEFVANADYNSVSRDDLIDEFEACRNSHVFLLKRAHELAWGRSGKADGKPISLRALAFLMAGHVRHHLAILQERSQAG
jgi:hypothetical protein